MRPSLNEKNICVEKSKPYGYSREKIAGCKTHSLMHIHIYIYLCENTYVRDFAQMQLCVAPCTTAACREKWLTVQTDGDVRHGAAAASSNCRESVICNSDWGLSFSNGGVIWLTDRCCATINGVTVLLRVEHESKLQWRYKEVRKHTPSISLINMFNCEPN